jgi:two-component system, LytTR family, response regulator
MITKKINLEEVAYFQASESYSIIVWPNGKTHMLARPLKRYSLNLEANGWCRIHRSYMVNPTFVTCISADRDYVCLENGEELPIARRKQKQVYQWRKEQI